MSIHDDFYPWLIEHACDLLNRFRVRKGNLTAWEFIKPYTGEIYGFGTPVMHRISGPVQGGVMAERWFDGIWLGLQFASGEHVVATSDGRVVRARAVHPRPDTVKVTREAQNNIKVGPWGPSEAITQGSATKPAAMAETPQPSQSAEPVPRSFRITQDLIEKFGFTKGCPKCEALRRNDEHRTVHHSRECRKRLEEEMTKGTTLSKKLSEVEERKKHYLARRIEPSDRERVEEVSLGSKGEDGGGPAPVPGVYLRAAPGADGATAEGNKHVTFSVPQLEQAHACEPESPVPGVSVHGIPGTRDPCLPVCEE